jgi:sulfonate transport system substrate-binding protein
MEPQMKFHGFGLATALLLAALSGVAPAAAPKLVVRVGYQPSSFVHILAKEKGWFEEEFSKDGIVIKHDLFPVGPPIVESFASGRSDIGYMADQPPVQGRSNNIDLKAIALTGSSEKSSGIVVSSKSSIRSLKDLKGKKIATAVGSILHQLLLIYLKSEGLKLSDVQLVNLVPADLNNALQSGHVDAVVNSDPYNAVAIKAGYGRLLVDATGYKDIVSLIIARNEFVKANPQVTARYLKVYQKAETWLYAHPEEALKILQKPTGFKPELLRPLLLNVKRGMGFRRDAVASVDATSKFLLENRIIRRPVDVKELFDDRYLRLAGIPTP